MNNRVTSLFNTRYPIIQAGMIWCSGWKLASAVSNAGGLGIIGAGSMTPELLEEHIRKCKAATQNPFGVNVPLLYHGVDKQIDVILREGVNIVITAAGNPTPWVPFLKKHGLIVAHVVASVRGAIKCAESGADAVIAEGFEAGGHIGKQETTTLTLIPLVREAVSLPLIAAGGIATGRGMLAVMALGAEGIQMGTRFAASVESSAHPEFKQKILAANDGDTLVTLKKLVPVRLLKNAFFDQLQELEKQDATPEQLKEFLGKERPKKGMFEGDLEQGELEIGEACALIHEIKSCQDIIHDVVNEFYSAKAELGEITFD
jgi:enoyl-[acyl-carrier protein] reductase II